jgi:hypothetical protein
MDFFVTVPEELYDQVSTFDSSLGMWFWNMAVMIYPYDTGNARRAISLERNTPKKIKIQYSLMNANYIKFLELGLGPVKKHKGKIGIETRLAIVEQLIIYLKTGRKPLFTRVPFTLLRNSKSVFPSEKAFLRSANMGVSTISPNQRRKISQIRETNYRKMIGTKNTNQRGMKVATSTMRQQSIKAPNNGYSMLVQMHKEARNS